MFSQATSASKENAGENLFDWELFFQTVISSFPKDVAIHITDDEIQLRGATSAIKDIHQRLEKMLRDPQSFFADQYYEIKLPPAKGKVYSVEELREVAPPAGDSLSEGKEILLSLFGKEVFDDIAISLKKLFPEGLAEVEGGVIYSKYASNEKYAKTWQAALEALLAHFNGVDITELRKAYLDKKTHLPPLVQNITEAAPAIAEGIAKECFGVQKVEGKGWRVYCDYMRMYELLFPPKLEITCDQDNPDEATLSLSRSHLMSYVRQLTQGGVLLRLYKDEKDAIQARTIIATRAHAINKPKHFVLVFDKSGSMSEGFQELKDRLKTFIYELNRLYPNATLRLVFFNEGVARNDFSLEDRDEIFRFIDKQRTEGQTRLIGTMDEELEQLKKDLKTESHQVTMVLFTDGVSNCGLNDSSVLDEKIKNFSEKPLIFSLGAGDYYDERLLGDLTAAVGGELHHMRDMSQFDVITDRIPEMGHVREFFEMIVAAAGQQEKQYSMPVALKNAPVTSVLIPFEEKEVDLTMAGHTVTMRHKENVPSARPIDKILKLQDDAYAVLAQVDEQKKNVAEARRELMQIKGELGKITSPESISDRQYEFVRRLQQDVEGMLKDLSLQDTKTAAKLLHARLSRQPIGATRSSPAEEKEGKGEETRRMPANV